MLPVLRNQSVDLDTIDPNSDEPLQLQITTEGKIITDLGVDEAVVSFGILRSGDGSVYETVCPYVNLFATRADYEQWARSNLEAFTLAMSLNYAVLLSHHWANAGKGCC